MRLGGTQKQEFSFIYKGKSFIHGVKHRDGIAPGSSPKGVKINNKEKELNCGEKAA